MVRIKSLGTFCSVKGGKMNWEWHKLRERMHTPFGIMELFEILSKRKEAIKDDLMIYLEKERDVSEAEFKSLFEKFFDFPIYKLETFYRIPTPSGNRRDGWYARAWILDDSMKKEGYGIRISLYEKSYYEFTSDSQVDSREETLTSNVGYLQIEIEIIPVEDVPENSLNLFNIGIIHDNKPKPPIGGFLFLLVDGINII